MRASIQTGRVRPLSAQMKAAYEWLTINVFWTVNHHFTLVFQAEVMIIILSKRWCHIFLLNVCLSTNLRAGNLCVSLRLHLSNFPFVDYALIVYNCHNLPLRNIMLSPPTAATHLWLTLNLPRAAKKEIVCNYIFGDTIFKSRRHKQNDWWRHSRCGIRKGNALCIWAVNTFNPHNYAFCKKFSAILCKREWAFCGW